MEEKKISIIAPVYNVGKYLEECILSLINQTHHNLEILLVDDGSTDASGTICDDYSAKDPRIKVIHQKNGGAGSAKNTALNTATGDYIAFVDSDDFVRPDYIWVLLDTLERERADIAECGFFLMRKSSKEAVDNQPTGVFSAEQFLERFLTDWKCSLLWNKLFKRELLDDLRFYEGRVIDDEFYTYKAVMRAQRIAVTAEPLYVYRQRKTGVTNQGRWRQRLLDRLAYYTERYDLVTGAFPRLQPLFLAELADNLMRMKQEVQEFSDLTAEVDRTMRRYKQPVLKSSLGIKTKYSYIKTMLTRPAGVWRAQEDINWEDFYD